MPADGFSLPYVKFAAWGGEGAAGIPGPDVWERDGRDAAEYRRHAV